MAISIAQNRDCIEAMMEFPDKFFDLAIVDPPYGIEKQISIGGGKHTRNKTKFHHLYNSGSNWDKRPGKDYFTELLRVSANQIICGGNYFCDQLKISRGWVIWDKMCDGMSSVNNEIIYTSFDKRIRTFRLPSGIGKGFLNKEGENIHPTQKPVILYEWLLKNYASPEWKILDTHLGSGSSRIAAANLGFDFWGYEIDKDYFEAQEKRFNVGNNNTLFDLTNNKPIDLF